MSPWWKNSALVLLLALLPRVLGLRGFVTVDEAMHWQARVAAFSAALADGRFADTILAGHPGVTTLWLGSVGLALERALQAAGLLGAADYQTHLALLRLPVALATALGPVFGYLLLRRLLDERVALLAALFWATNPFLIAHSRLLHLDALLTTFLMLGLLGLLAAFFDSDGPLACPAYPLLALAGAAFGLALLTKVPSIILLPMAALIAAVWVWHGRTMPAVFRHGATEAQSIQPVGYGGRRALAAQLTLAARSLILWLVTALALAFVLWPALWVAPVAAVMRLVRETIDNGDSPHGWGNFFLGQAIADPGLWFYPAVLALRTTPWTLLGLLGGLASGVWALGRRIAGRKGAAPVLSLLLFVLLFVLMMTLAAKKFDRYVLPVFPSLDILAAVGLITLLDVARGRPGERKTVYGRGASTKVSLSRVFCLVLLALQVATLWWYHPYYLAYYNPLLGGGSVATRVLPVGWGEGMDLAAEWLNTQPDRGDGAVASWFEFTLAPYVDGKVFSVGYLRRGREFFNYVVIYVDQVQRRNEPTIIDAYLGRRTPLHIVRIHGIDYAWIYQVPPPLEQANDARFDERFRLLGSSIDATGLRVGEPLSLTLALTVDTPQSEQPRLFVHVLGPDGRRYGQIDVAASDERFAVWQPGRYITRHLPVALPADAPPGEYRVLMGLYRSADGSRLSLSAGQPADPLLDGEDALLLGTFRR